MGISVGINLTNILGVEVLDVNIGIILFFIGLLVGELPKLLYALKNKNKQKPLRSRYNFTLMLIDLCYEIRFLWLITNCYH